MIGSVPYFLAPPQPIIYSLIPALTKLCSVTRWHLRAPTSFWCIPGIPWLRVVAAHDCSQDLSVAEFGGIPPTPLNRHLPCGNSHKTKSGTGGRLADWAGRLARVRHVLFRTPGGCMHRRGAPQHHRPCWWVTFRGLRINIKHTCPRLTEYPGLADQHRLQQPSNHPDSSHY